MCSFVFLNLIASQTKQHTLKYHIMFCNFMKLSTISSTLSHFQGTFFFPPEISKTQRATFPPLGWTPLHAPEAERRERGNVRFGRLLMRIRLMDII